MFIFDNARVSLHLSGLIMQFHPGVESIKHGRIKQSGTKTNVLAGAKSPGLFKMKCCLKRPRQSLFTLAIVPVLCHATWRA